MIKILVFILCIHTFLFGGARANNNSCSEDKKKVVCYYASWATYRPSPGNADVPDIDPNLCTHLVYTFAGLDVIHNEITSLDPWNDFATNGGRDSYRRFIQLKEKNPCLKTLLAIGGWNEKSLKYSVMSATPESRTQFANSVLRYLAQYEFDGIDFDWEYPGMRGGIPADKKNFVALLSELRRLLYPWKLSLSIAVAATKDIADIAYEIKDIITIVDYISVMAYDFTSSESKTTGLLAPLEPVDSSDQSQTISKTIDLWISQGCPPSKLILGIPLYARSFKLKSSTENGIGAETVPNDLAGDFTQEIGFLSQYEMAGIFLNYNYEEKTHDKYQNNYATNGTYWITYDTEKTIAKKVDYALSKGLGGIMAWSVDTDDFGPIYNDISYPLLTAINNELYKNDLN